MLVGNFMVVKSCTPFFFQHSHPLPVPEVALCQRGLRTRSRRCGLRDLSCIRFLRIPVITVGRLPW